MMLFLQLGVLAMFWLNPSKRKGCISSSSFYGQHLFKPTIIQTFLALTTQWMSSPSRKWGCGVSLWFHLVAFVLGERIAEKIENWGGGGGGGGEGSPRFTLGGELLCRPSKSYRKLLDRVAFLQQQWSYSVKICGALLGDWTNGGYADGLLHVWWVGFSTLGSWSYSEEWVWMSWTKLCSTVREVKCQQGSFPKIQY